MSGYFEDKEKKGVFSSIINNNEAPKVDAVKEKESPIITVKSEPKKEINYRESKYGPIDKLDLRNITQIYTDAKGTKNVVFDNLQFKIKDIKDRGQFTVVVGASGCGKSTILRYIAGLQNPTSGEVFINGKLRTNSDTVGMVFQQYSSLPWATVLENVRLPLEIDSHPDITIPPTSFFKRTWQSFFSNAERDEQNEKAMEMIKLVGLEGHENKYAQYPILSGGQLQRVAIARSLIANNEMLLLDEPFGALDVNTRLKMQDMLVDIWEKIKGDPTFILVTHDLTEAVYLADEIYVMKTNPGEICDFIEVDIPGKRDLATKRTPKFLDHLHYLEDVMMKINSK